jgi:hypothetical protein
MMGSRSKEPIDGTPGEELSVVARSRAELVGRSWAADLRASLLREKRRASGGWPGTLGEARMHVARALLPWLDSHGQRIASSGQSEGAARVVYASARSAWLASCDPDEDY